MGELIPDRWAKISADGTFDGTSVYTPNRPPAEEVAEGETVELIPIGWDPDPSVSLAAWAGNIKAGATGWMDVNLPPQVGATISAVSFKLLFTQAERMAIHAAAATDFALYDYLDLITTSGAGIELIHPVVIAGIQHLVDTSIITADRAVQILAGTAPA